MVGQLAGHGQIYITIAEFEDPSDHSLRDAGVSPCHFMFDRGLIALDQSMTRQSHPLRSHRPTSPAAIFRTVGAIRRETFWSTVLHVARLSEQCDSPLGEVFQATHLRWKWPNPMMRR